MERDSGGSAEGSCAAEVLERTAQNGYLEVEQLERLLQEHLWEPAKISELIANLEAYRDADGHISLEGLADPVLRGVIEGEPLSPTSILTPRGTSPLPHHAFSSHADRLDSPSPESKDYLLYFFQGLVQRSELSESALESALSAVDEHVGATQAAHAEKARHMAARAEQAEKDARQLRDANAVLSDEYTRLEEELAQAAVHKNHHVAHVAEGKSAEIAELHDEIGELQHQIASLRKDGARVIKLEAERDRLVNEVDGRDRQLEQLQDLIRSIEADRECVSAELEQAQIENDRLGEELEGLSEKLNREGHKVHGQQQHATQLVEQNSRMRERTGELREIITMKDDAIKKLRRTVDDQTLLIQSLRCNSVVSDRPAEKKSSIMSEISEYVRTRTEDSRPPSVVGQAASPTPDSGPTSPVIDAGAIRTLEDLGARMSFYASALQQAATGQQLVTDETVTSMSLEKLQRMATVLRELVASKSEQLMEAFQEREALEGDIEMKKQLSAHLIEHRRALQASSSVRPGSAESPSEYSASVRSRRVLPTSSWRLWGRSAAQPSTPPRPTAPTKQTTSSAPPHAAKSRRDDRTPPRPNLFT